MADERNKSLFLLCSSIILTGSALFVLFTFTITDQIGTTSVERTKKKVTVSNKIVEACVSDIETFVGVIQGGVNSVELCTNRLEGGTTPSYGFIKRCVEIVNQSNLYKHVEIHVLIRPRPGDFVYTDKEFEVICNDINAAKMVKVEGIVFGALHADLSIDMVKMLYVRKLCGNDLKLTFHRAFDILENPIQSLMSIVDIIQCDRLLTSGSGFSAMLGINTLRNISEKCGNSIDVIAAAGIGVDNVYDIIVQSKVQGVHFGNAIMKDVQYHSEGMSAVYESFITKSVVDQHVVRQICDIAKSAWKS